MQHLHTPAHCSVWTHEAKRCEMVGVVKAGVTVGDLVKVTDASSPGRTVKPLRKHNEAADGSL